MPPLNDVHPLQFSPSRRSFLKFTVASLALPAAACAPPPEKIVGFVDSRNAPLPGEPRFYASALVRSGYASGVLVELNEGRPVKVEGNPAHPSSLGATDVFAQAEVLGFWDPDRSRSMRNGALPSSREALASAIEARAARAEQQHGEGLRILTGYVSSPTAVAQMRAVLKRWPAARWHQWDPLHRDSALRGATAAFGKPVSVLPRLEHADVIVSFDADFIGEGAGHLAHARAFVDRRRETWASGSMSRLYVAESVPGLTGDMADHRYPMSVAAIDGLVAETAALIGGSGAAAASEHARTLARALQAARGRALVLAGAALSPDSHALLHWINAQLDAAGNTLDWVETPEGNNADCGASLAQLVDDMRAGRVESLLIVGGNPVYDAPVDFGFGDALSRVPFSLHLSLEDNETSALATWHAPQAHAFEQWSDALAEDGTASIVQPVIAPLYGGLSFHELLGMLTHDARAPYEIVRGHWRSRASGDFETYWASALASGIAVPAPRASTRLQPRRPAPSAKPSSASGWTVRFHPDQSVRAGEYANNAWLQELPRSHTKLTWDNAALISPVSARELDVETGDLLEITIGERRLRAPAWIQPAQANGVLALALGYGRTRAGRIGKGVGFNAYALRSSSSPWSQGGVTVRKADAPRHAFATTQNHAVMEGRNLLRHASLAQFQADPKRFQPAEDHPGDSLYPQWPYEGYRWGMAIDLGACIGCNACTIACQAENNIPTVGKEQVIAGREMHWIRVDRYFEGPAETARTMYMPVPCMHCEHAPCEYVCPVEASIHDSEGLNVQVYNRCVGTRFCSQNCPYKVRRFNFLQYSNQSEESLKGAQNPEVTVRSRGVMEKCTYCVQRITRARIEAEKDGRRIADGEVVTACQAACPTRAISFGDLNDPKSAVNAAKASPLNYPLLGELNTRPRTTYLARLSNPEPEKS